MSPHDLPRLLLVEDDTAVMALLSMELKRRGYLVETAKSGEEALSRLSGPAYDVVLTDLKLGDVDGLKVLKRVKGTQP